MTTATLPPFKPTEEITTTPPTASGESAVEETKEKGDKTASSAQPETSTPIGLSVAGTGANVVTAPTTTAAHTPAEESPKEAATTIDEDKDLPF